MKKCFSIFITLCLLLTFGYAESWVCTNCDTSANGNFCSTCGQKKPPNDGQYMLHLIVDFEENLFMSTYDAEVYINDTKVAVIPHGENLNKVINVPEGICTITFYEVRNHTVQGFTKVGINKDTDFRCSIKAKNDSILINSIITDGEEVDLRIPVGTAATIDGVQVTLTNVRTTKGSSYNKATSGSTYLMCEFEFVNQSKDEISISTYISFEAYCDDYKQDTSFSALLEAKTQLDGSVAPGKKFKGEVGFEVPTDWEVFEISYSPSFFSSDKLTFVAFNK